MSRNLKAKQEIYSEMSIQEPIAIIDSSATIPSLEKRKEDASKPLYLKRV